MATYSHSAYWYAKNRGWTYSDKTTFTEQYLDLYASSRTFYDQPSRIGRGSSLRSYASPVEAPIFNPILLGVCVAMDIGVAVKRNMDMLRDPVERDRIRRELVRDLRVVRRPLYYIRETERRRRLAAERRAVSRRSTVAPMPTPEGLLAAWNARKTSREAMVRLGGMLQDLECYVDNGLRFDADGTVVGRNGGIRGWLRENLPELSPKYKTLMRYKALAVRLRQATGTRDPTPTAALLEGPRHEAVEEILSDPAPVFARVFDAVDRLVSVDRVFLDAPKAAKRSPGQRRRRRNARRGTG